jgi:hypothetical protein
MELLEPGQEVLTEDILRVDQDDNLVVPAEQVAEFLVLLDRLIMAFKGTFQTGGNGEFWDVVAPLCQRNSKIFLLWP